MYWWLVSSTPTIAQCLSVTDSLSGQGSVLNPNTHTCASFEVWDGVLLFVWWKHRQAVCLKGLAGHRSLLRKNFLLFPEKQKERQHSVWWGEEMSDQTKHSPHLSSDISRLIRLRVPTARQSHILKWKTHYFLLVVSLAEVLAIALGARLVLVVLPPKCVQLLRNASEREF